MLTVVLITASFAAQSPAPVPYPSVRCTPVAGKATMTGRAGMRKLGEMPPGQQIKAVWRFDENGCPKPLIVRSEVGADGRR